MLKPEWLCRRQRQRQIASRYVRLSEASSRGIVSGAVDAFRSLFAQSRSRRRGGLDLGFIRLTSEALEPRRLLSSSPVYVANLLGDPTYSSTNNYWVLHGTNTPVTGSTPSGTAVDTLDGTVTNASWLTNAFNILNTAVANVTPGAAPASPGLVEVLAGSYSGIVNVSHSFVEIEGITGLPAIAGTVTIGPENNVTINGLAISARAGKAGVVVQGGAAIESCTISGNQYGVEVESGGDAMLSFDDIYSNTADGIDVTAGAAHSSYNTIYANTVAGIGVSAGTLDTSTTINGISNTGQDNIYQNGAGVLVSGTGSATLSGESIYDNTIGVHVEAGSGTVELDTTSFSGAAPNTTDLQIDASAGAVTLGSSDAFDASTSFIANLSSQGIDATSDTFDVGVGGAQVGDGSLSVTEAYAVNSEITDAISNPAYGLVRITSGNIFVTPQAAAAAAEIGGSAIANAEAAASNGDTINVDGSLAFSNFASSQTISYGTSSVTLSGTILAGDFVPAGNVEVSIDDIDEFAAIQSNGAFSLSFPTSAISASATAYNITYQYQSDTGSPYDSTPFNYSTDGSSNSASDTSTSLTVIAASPTLTTTASPATVTLGATAPTISDSAVLAGGYNETGTVSFTLMLGSTTVYTTSDTVTGDGTYTASYTLPTSGTVTGTYAWTDSYSGDANNNPATGNTDSSEQTVVSLASPTLSTLPSATSVTLGNTGSPVLTDTATLAGGYYETGDITFNLYYNGGATPVDTETVTVNGNGSYATPAGYTLPSTGTVTGTYQWDATYGPDGNNNAVSDNGNANEQVTVSLASPTLVTTASAALTLGATAPTISDSAVLAGGYIETGTVSFTLMLGSTTVYTTSDAVTGDGTYSASYTLPTSGTVTGTYAWTDGYSGDANNNPASGNTDSREQTVVSLASPTLSTLPSASSVTLSNSGRRSSRTRPRWRAAITRRATSPSPVLQRRRHAGGHGDGDGQRQRHLHHARPATRCRARAP